MKRWLALLWVLGIPLALIGVIRFLYFVCGVPYDLDAAHIMLGISIIIGLPIGGVIAAIGWGNNT